MELGTTLYLQVNATHVDVLAAVNGVLSNSVLKNTTLLMYTERVEQCTKNLRQRNNRAKLCVEKIKEDDRDFVDDTVRYLHTMRMQR